MVAPSEAVERVFGDLHKEFRIEGSPVWSIKLMAESIGAWIASAIIKHDQAHGADLSIPWSKAQYCQVIQFDTYRSPQNPRAQICGVISDKTHKIHVTFDIAATDEHERSVAGEIPETLTSSLRAVLLLTSLRFHLSPPPVNLPHDSPLAGIPRIRLDILGWRVVSGDRNDPVFYDDTEEIGKRQSDDAVRAVLRRWWSGELMTETSKTGSSLTRSEPSRTEPSHNLAARAADPADASTISFAEFLVPYVDSSRKRQKPIPECIFQGPSSITQDVLSKITFFGLELKPLEDSKDANESATGKELPNMEEDGLVVTSGFNEVDLERDNKILDSPIIGSIPNSPVERDTGHTKTVEDNAQDSDMETNGDMETEYNEYVSDADLSDYEREQRRSRAKLVEPPAALSHSPEEDQDISLSLPQTQRSSNSFGLSRYATDVAGEEPTKETETSHPASVSVPTSPIKEEITQQGPNPVAVAVAEGPVPPSGSGSPLAPASEYNAIKRLGTSLVSTIDPNDDRSLSDPVVAPKRPRSSDSIPPRHTGSSERATGSAEKRIQRSNALGMLNPINLFRSSSRAQDRDDDVFSSSPPTSPVTGWAGWLWGRRDDRYTTGNNISRQNMEEVLQERIDRSEDRHSQNEGVSSPVYQREPSDCGSISHLPSADLVHGEMDPSPTMQQPLSLSRVAVILGDRSERKAHLIPSSGLTQGFVLEAINNVRKARARGNSRARSKISPRS